MDQGFSPGALGVGVRNRTVFVLIRAAPTTARGLYIWGPHWGRVPYTCGPPAGRVPYTCGNSTVKMAP
jgi:hypothetical protein